MLLIHSLLAVLLTAINLFVNPTFARPAPADGSLNDSPILASRDGDFPSIQDFPPKVRSHCDLRKAVLPVGDGPTYLSSPAPLRLKLVALGYGTQNYTCADSTANSKPVLIGPLAKVYDVSCLAVSNPTLLHQMPGKILDNPTMLAEESFHDIGMHFFYSDASTPMWVIDGKHVSRHKKGKFVGKKIEDIPAPANAPVGVPPNAFGAIDWLKLVRKVEPGTAAPPEFQSYGYKEVYRVITAGGDPPATCQGRPPLITIPYATEYWLYN